MEFIKKILQSKRNIAIILVVILLFVFWNRRSTSQNKNIPQKTEVKQSDLKEELTLSGEIDAHEKVVVRFQTSGRLSYVGVKEGQFVKKGQVLASLDRRELKKKLDKELNTFLNQRYSFDQTKDDNKDKAVTDAIKRVLDTSQNNLNKAVIDVELQSIALEFSTITSPISGIVTSISSPIAGVNVTPSQAEFEIINPDSIFFTATADQTEVTKIKKEQPVEIVLDAFDDQTLNGVVESISFTPKSGETGTVYEFIVSIPSSKTESMLRMGMTGDATIIVSERKDTLYLPSKFVFLDKKKPYVLLMKNNKVKETTIVTGLETEDRIEIKSGLKKNDVVYDKTD